MKNPWLIASVVLGIGFALLLGLLIGQNQPINKKADENTATPTITKIVTVTPSPSPTNSVSSSPSEKASSSTTKKVTESKKTETTKSEKSKSASCDAFWSLREAYNVALRTTHEGGPGAAENAQNSWQTATENLAQKINTPNEALNINMKDYVWMMREVNDSLYPTYQYRKWDAWHAKIVNLGTAISNLCNI